MLQGLLAYLSHVSPITWLVLGVLSLYFIVLFWIFFYRYWILNSWLDRESSAVEHLVGGGADISTLSVLSACAQRGGKTAMEACLQASAKESSVGLTLLSIIASTSPFVGLFGTVVSILDSFANMGIGGGHVTMEVVAPAISEALIATAAGIFVAIWAYAFHLLLKRRAYEIMTYLAMQINLMESRHDDAGV